MRSADDYANEGMEMAAVAIEFGRDETQRQLAPLIDRLDRLDRQTRIEQLLQEAERQFETQALDGRDSDLSSMLARGVDAADLVAFVTSHRQGMATSLRMLRARPLGKDGLGELK